VTAVVSLGTNLGDRIGHLRAGLEVLGQHVPVVAVSPVYETDPVGGVEQPAFLNIVALVESDDAEVVFAAAQAAEQARGRLRSVRWGPRSLDVDVIAVDRLERADPWLTLPHPRARERRFVLVPWLAVDPAAFLPGDGPVRAIVDRIPDQGMRRYADPLPLP
jgi:2-amino-4-hydroxy-6-hydroxymethyldihydropteridine diphosphokinase